MTVKAGRSLAGFTGAGYDKGRGVAWQVAWLVIAGVITQRVWCPNKLRIAMLRRFGADIGTNVLIRHGVRIHWPWKLTVGDNSWIGVDAWLLNLEPISIGADVCISQGVLLCTGSHDRRSPTFEFDNGPITIGDSTWIAARATVLRGVTIGQDVVVGATVLVSRDILDGEVLIAPNPTKVQPNPPGGARNGSPNPYPSYRLS